jgi:uncharacterized membrane-anchored protein
MGRPPLLFLAAFATASFLAVPAVVQASHRATPLQARTIEETLTYRTGVVAIQDAKITLPDGFRYLLALDAERVLHDEFGNPPDSTVEALIVPNGDSAWAAPYVIGVWYADTGHVTDHKTAQMDYPAALARIKRDVIARNVKLRQQGYDVATVVGWAEPPHYDTRTHTLYWPRELAFEGQATHALGYRVRVFGRDTALDLDAISRMPHLDDVRRSMAAVLAGTRFSSGRTYADYPTRRAAGWIGIAIAVASSVLLISTRRGRASAMLAPERAIIRTVRRFRFRRRR